jgi:hypothetical protein
VGRYISSAEFCHRFGMEEDEARHFLTFISMGIEFKEKHLSYAQDPGLGFSSAPSAAPPS